MMTQPATTTPPFHKDGDIGRCQHCQQTRPLFRHQGEFQSWELAPDDAAWLCARDWSARDTAIDNDHDIHIEYDLIVWPEQEPRVHSFGGRCYDDASGIHKGEDFGPCVVPYGHDGPHADTDDNRWMRADTATAVESGSGGSRADGNQP